MSQLNCDNDLKKLVPLRRVVGTAAIHLHEDFSKVEQVLTHLAANGLKKLDRETLKSAEKKIILPIVNKMSSLPIDFNEIIAPYFVENGMKIPLSLDRGLIDTKNIEVVECEDKCPRCAQDTSICNDLTVTETIETVLVNPNTSPPTTADKTIVKKLYPDGKYFLETTTPVWNVDEEVVEYVTTKEFITELDLKPCGCIEETESNLEKIKICSPDVYCCYWGSCSCACNPQYSGYNIFEDTGIIKFNNPGTFTQVYLEYYGFLAKKNGQWMVPQVAFDTLVELVKDQWLWNKRNIPRWERLDQHDRYKEERRNMEKVMGRISISQLMEAVLSTPKFDWVI